MSAAAIAPQLRMTITPDATHSITPAGTSTGPRPRQPGFATATLSDIQFPKASAGALGSSESAWSATPRQPNQSALAEATRRFGPLAPEERTGASGVGLPPPAPTASDLLASERARLLSIQIGDLQASAARKDALIQSLEEQVSDMTRALEAQSAARSHWEHVEAQRDQQMHQLQAHTAAAEDEIERLAHALQVERDEHVQAKQLLKMTAERQEGKWRAVRDEMEQCEAARDEAERRAKQLQAAMEQQADAIAQGAQRQQELEAQVRALTSQCEELSNANRTASSDQQYLVRDLQSLKQQTELKDDELKQAQQALQAQQSLAERLTRELEGQRVEVSSLRNAGVESEAQLTMQRNLRRAAEEEANKLQARLGAAEEQMETLQAVQHESADKDVELADVKQQLAASLAALDQAKDQHKSLHSALAAAHHSLEQLESHTVPSLQRQVAELQAHQLKTKIDLDTRTRFVQMHVEQIRQLAAKNPFNPRLEAAHGSAALVATHNVSRSPDSSYFDPATPQRSPLSASTSAASAQAADAESFSQLRDQLNAQLLDMNARTRLAYGLLQDSDRSLKHAHDQLADYRKANESLQRELEESAVEQRARLHQLEQQYMQSQQELLAARSEAHESIAHSSLHHAQLRQVWQTCLLLHRAYMPLLARFRDVVGQKDLMAQQLLQYQTGLARDVFDLRVAMTSFEHRQASAAALEAGVEHSVAIAPAPLRSTHPFRLHSPRISFRSVAIGVLAARRFWVLQGGAFGVMVRVGGERVPVLASSTFQLSDGHAGSEARREREMKVPEVDDSTIDKAAASLLRLLDHFSGTAASSSFAVNPQLHRSNGAASSHSDLLQSLAAGFSSFHSTRKQRRPLSDPAPANTRDDLARIRSLTCLLATRNKDFERQLLNVQAEYVDLIQQSTRTEELLQREQERAHAMMRRSVEQARDQEQGANQLIHELKQQLLAAESERVSKDEYAQLHHTSEMVLRKCRELEQQNLELTAQQAALKQQTEKVKSAGGSHCRRDRPREKRTLLALCARSFVSLVVFVSHVLFAAWQRVARA